MLQFMGLLQVVTGNQNPKSLLTIQNMDLINSEYLAATWLPRCSVVKNPPANAGDARDTGSIPGSGTSLGRGNDNPLWYSCLENLMDLGACQTTVHRFA